MTFTYREVGATREGETMPAGYHVVDRHAAIGHGWAAFVAAAETLATFGVQRGAGLRVRASAERAAVGVQVAVGLGVGPLRVWAPCEIVWATRPVPATPATPTTYGWAYGTLPGHPESGEEAWLVSIDAAERVRCGIRAFSRPVRWFARLGGPVTRSVQARVTDGYVRALAHAAAGVPQA